MIKEVTIKDLETMVSVVKLANKNLSTHSDEFDTILTKKIVSKISSDSSFVDLDDNIKRITVLIDMAGSSVLNVKGTSINLLNILTELKKELKLRILEKLNDDDFRYFVCSVLDNNQNFNTN